MNNSSKMASIVANFDVIGDIADIRPLGNGLINDTFFVETCSSESPDYVLQRINTAIFTNVDMLQHNIEAVTQHIRRKLVERGTSDIDRRVLKFIKSKTGGTYYRDADNNCWRVSVYIQGSHTLDIVDAENAHRCGEAFGEFESMLADLPISLGETIPRFHDMELRADQFEEAVRSDRVGRLKDVKMEVDMIESLTDDMCLAERLHRDGMLPKRVCHCDTKVNNMLLDDNNNVLCVIDLDTVMPSYVFSDYGDFLRTAANTVAEDEPDTSKVDFRQDIFEAFTTGYIRGTRSFLTDTERDYLHYAVALFPYMQATRFLTDYLNGDVYYKTTYQSHNLDRTRNQLALLGKVIERLPQLERFIKSV